MPERISYRDAIRSALRTAMRADDRVILLGEDIATAGGVFKVTEGLLAEFGPQRVMDTPISETAFVGAAIGLALRGFRPVVELMFADFAAVAWDQIVNQAAKYRYMSAGQMSVPLVIRACGGAGGRFAAQHSQTTESWFTPFPGVKVVAPSDPADAYALILAAIAEDDPVVVIEHKALYTREGDAPQPDQRVRIPSARLLREGADVTIVASLAMVARALEAADALRVDGLSAEIIDLRCIWPMDIESVVRSVERTGRLVTVEEQSVAGGWGGHLVAEVTAAALDRLLAPPARLGLPAAPIPFSPVLEDAVLPSVEQIASAARSCVKWT